MPATESSAARAAPTDELRDAIERALAERSGLRVAVTRLSRRPSKHSSSYATEIVTAHLADRKPLRLFLKDFAVAAWQKDLMPERRMREVHVYRHLLDDAGLGTPGYLGAVWDEARGRHWLLLEYVEGPQVKWCKFADWQRAAGWLARLHGRFPSMGALSRVDFLVQHDAAYFVQTCVQARAAAGALAPALGRRLDSALRGYGGLAEEMAALPRTLVHGGYRPQNIIRGLERGDVRICPADWEEAAYGSRFYDFAYLSDGFEPARFGALWATYRDQAAREGLELTQDASAARLISAFNVHKNLGTLAKAVDRKFSASAVERLVGMVERSAVGTRA